MSKAHSPYFDQEDPVIDVECLIADLDISERYELEAAAVFKTKTKYLIVFVSGCSCWPTKGTTEQIICNNKTDVDKKLRGKWNKLLQKCQDGNWAASQLRA